MGVTRVDDLPERGLARNLAEARQVARERKGSPQRVSGANLAFFTSSSPSTYDWTGRLDTLDSFASRGYASFSITLTSETAEVPLTDIAITVYTSSDGVSWSEYTYAQGVADYYNGNAPEMVRFIDVLQGAEVDANTARYSLLLHGTYNAYAAFKVQAFGSDEVTISVTRTA